MDASMTCRWTSSITPRVVDGRHEGELGSDPIHARSCKGCAPCLEPHCAVCGHEHAETVCPRCVGATRADLADIATLTEALPEQAITNATAAIPGGTAAVLTGPASAGIAQQWAETYGHDASHKVDEHGTPVPVLLLLATWEDAWHDVLGTADPPARRASVGAAVAWLSEHLHDVCDHLAFPEFAAEIRTARAGLESVLLAGRRDHIGTVRCLSDDCGALLRQVYDDPKPCRHGTPARRDLAAWLTYGVRTQRWQLLAAREPCGRTECDQGGRRDKWTCPACHREYDDEAYRLARSQAREVEQPIRPGVQIARDLGISADRLRQWITRGHVERKGQDQRGRVLLDVREVRQHAMRSGQAS